MHLKHLVLFSVAATLALFLIILFKILLYGSINLQEPNMLILGLEIIIIILQYTLITGYALIELYK